MHASHAIRTCMKTLRPQMSASHELELWAVAVRCNLHIHVPPARRTRRAAGTPLSICNVAGRCRLVLLHVDAAGSRSPTILHTCMHVDRLTVCSTAYKRAAVGGQIMGGGCMDTCSSQPAYYYTVSACNNQISQSSHSRRSHYFIFC